MTEEKPQPEHPDQRYAEFTGWFEAQDHGAYAEYGRDDMADAFVAGMQAARDLAAAEPEQPTVVIVTTDTGTEHRYRADEFDPDGALHVRDTARKANTGIIGAYAEGCWRSVRYDGTTEPDGTARALAIAKRALEAIAHSRPEKPDDVAQQALDEIFAETEA